MRNLEAQRRSLLGRPIVGAALVVSLFGAFGSGACTVFDTEPQAAYDASAGEGGTGASGGIGGSGGASGSGGSGAGDSGPSGPFWETQNAHGCRVASAPRPDQRPSSALDAADQPEFFLAMTFIRLGATGAPAATINDPSHLRPDTTAYQQIGFDLDGACSASSTCEDEQAEAGADGGRPLVRETSCTPPTPALPQGQTDGTNCRDNAVGVTIPLSYSAPTTSKEFGVNENDWNCELHRGGFGVMFRIRNYNYTANDPKVTLDIYNTLGLVEQRNWWCRGGRSAPNITANQSSAYGEWRTEAPWFSVQPWIYANSNWTSDPGGTDFLPNSKIRTETAYVRDGYLVAFLPPASHVGFIGKNSVTPGIRLTVERGVFAGQLLKEATGEWALKNATLAGAVDPAVMLDAFEKIGYCENNMCGSFRNIALVLNGVRDVFLDPTGKTPSQTCDGMSIGMALEARQARADGFTKEDDPFLVDCPAPRHPDSEPQSCSCPAGVSNPICGDGGTSAGDGG